MYENLEDWEVTFGCKGMRWFHLSFSATFNCYLASLKVLSWKESSFFLICSVVGSKMHILLVLSMFLVICYNGLRCEATLFLSSLCLCWGLVSGSHPIFFLTHPLPKESGMWTLFFYITTLTQATNSSQLNSIEGSFLCRRLLYTLLAEVHETGEKQAWSSEEKKTVTHMLGLSAQCLRAGCRLSLRPMRRMGLRTWDSSGCLNPGSRLWSSFWRVASESPVSQN